MHKVEITKFQFKFNSSEAFNLHKLYFDGIAADDGIRRNMEMFVLIRLGKFLGGATIPLSLCRKKAFLRIKILNIPLNW